MSCSHPRNPVVIRVCACIAFGVPAGVALAVVGFCALSLLRDVNFSY